MRAFVEQDGKWRLTVTVEDDRIELNGSTHDDGYAPVQMSIDELQLFVDHLRRMCVLADVPFPDAVP